YRSYFYITSLPLSINHSVTTVIYTLSLHDALPISASLAHFTLLSFAGHRLRDRLGMPVESLQVPPGLAPGFVDRMAAGAESHLRSEEHTSELQSRENLVCRLLLEKKK